MTCIVGFMDNGTVYIGGDSAGVSGLNVRQRTDPKVFVKDGMVFGFTTSFRMGQLLRHAFEAPKRGDGPLRNYMCGPWIEAVRQCFKDHGYAHIENSVDKGGNFIVGFEGQLFEVHSDFQVAEYAEPFTATGCGEEFALGSIYGQAKNGSKHPRDIVLDALRAAEHFSGGVCAPFVIESA